MKRKISYTGLPLAGLASMAMASSPMPSDTYFSVAVSDNSHNHYGENLMFLDFRDRADFEKRHPRTVVSARVPNSSVYLDGQATEWSSEAFTRIRGRVMNNYPLSEHYDATPTEIRIASAYDDEYIYFILQYEDANRDASIDRNRWVYDGTQWITKKHVKTQSGAAADASLNRAEPLVGNEDEDQVFMMFPITDQQGNFRDGGLGCGGYCHPNLSISADPQRSQIGDGVSSMHTAVPEDIADLWHWTATRSRPMNTLKDGYVDYGDSSYNGRKVDDGEPPFENNAELDPYRPKYVSKRDFDLGVYGKSGHTTRQLTGSDLMPITPDMKFVAGDSLPFYVAVPGSGSRVDVQTAAEFDSTNHTWTIELKRRLTTDDENDRQFVDVPAALPPQLSMVHKGDPARGERLFKDKTCASCHGDKGEGSFENGAWVYPRNQRTSAPAIRKTVSPFRPERLHSLAFELKKYDEEPPKALMPFVPLTPQEAEDIAAYLQRQFIPNGK